MSAVAAARLPGARERLLAAAEAVDGPGGAVERLEAVLGIFARRALQNPWLVWALLAEPVDPLLDAERRAYRRRYADVVARELTAAIGAGEALVSPIETFVRRAIEAAAR